MLLKLGILQRLYQKHSKIINHFSTSLLPKYPYKFKGVLSPSDQTSSPITALKQTFDDDTIQGFAEAYQTILQAIESKDIQFLKTVMESRLTQKLSFLEVQLVNSTQKPIVSKGQSFIVMGGQFQRSKQKMPLTKITEISNNLMQFYVGSMPQGMGLSKRIPMHLGFQIYFTGKKKLVLKDGSKQSQQNLIQNHVLQFQTLNMINPMDITPLMSTLNKYGSFKSNNVPIDQIKQLRQFLLGKDRNWKIGDMDLVLNRNLDINTKSGNNPFSNFLKP